jgi:hypothetical protein
MHFQIHIVNASRCSFFSFRFAASSVQVRYGTMNAKTGHAMDSGNMLIENKLISKIGPLCLQLVLYTETILLSTNVLRQNPKSLTIGQVVSGIWG